MSYPLSEALGAKLKARSWSLALAESCTGGQLAQAITAVPGSSAWFDCGVVSYSNHSKTALLGIDPNLLERYGAVSSEVAIAMAEGILQRSQAQLALAITGIAGPEGGSLEKPVGLVHFALAQVKLPTQAREQRFQGDRSAIRTQAVEYALAWLLAL